MKVPALAAIFDSAGAHGPPGERAGERAAVPSGRPLLVIRETVELLRR
jgi:hypothetical protein